MVKRSAAERIDLDQAAAARGLLRIPADGPLNYTSFQSGQTLSGRGEAAAVQRDGAMCSARCSDAGAAWGEFYLGYCFDNVSGSPLEGALKLRLKANQKRSLKHAPGEHSEDASDASLLLKFLVKDTNGQTVRSEDILTGTDPRGSTGAAVAPELSYDLRIEPERGYYLVLMGRSETKTGAGHSAEAALEVSGVSMELTWRQAAPSASAPAESRAAAAGASATR